METNDGSSIQEYTPPSLSTPIPYNTDQKFLVILKELKKCRSREYGAPLKLTFEGYLQLILSLALGQTREKACLLANINHVTFYRYLHRSASFRDSIELAEGFQEDVISVSVMNILLSTQDHCIKTVDRKGNPMTLFREGSITQGKIRFLMWFAERRDIRYAKHKLCRHCRRPLTQDDFR